MGNKSSPELVLLILLMTSLSLEALTIKNTISLPPVKMNWENARLYCQKNYIDLVTWDVVDGPTMTKLLMDAGVKEVWIGLLRDPENDSAWKWINLKTGKGITGLDVSQSANWADGHQSGHCAFVSVDDLKWHSGKCSSEYNFYCSSKDNIEYHAISLDWSNASLHCQRQDSYLSTITQTNTNQLKNSGWIGLHREAGETWRWDEGLTSDYRNWASGEPLNADCATFRSDTEKLHSAACSKELPPVCYSDNLVVVNLDMTWEEAVSYCLSIETPCIEDLQPCTFKYNLLSMEKSYSSSFVRERIDRTMTDEFWIGLRFLGGQWWWLNGQKLEDEKMLPNCLTGKNYCGTLSKHTNNWINRDCSEKRNFICYGEIVMNDGKK